ncbi:MAG: hypothetical protein JRG83_06620 [Deltaproteobacteria bacterium]|nr:hypothetical protein [Deltaproteobacteria bacterium]
MRIPRTVAHYGAQDPRVATGGVETFARNLRVIFDEVLFLTPAARGEARIRRERIPVLCDNHWVRDWPEEIPVIGFQHGVALDKFFVTRLRVDAGLAFRQWRAARRRNTLWVAAAPWVQQRFDGLHGNRAAHVIHHVVDHRHFDGKLENVGSRLVLHDARGRHKGRELIPALAEAFPEWRFEGLDCEPEQVPDRMRRAAAFLHLSAYEGNSIVCNEAMAMDLPCLFTEVGLFCDDVGADVATMPRRIAFGGRAGLIEAVGRFLGSLATRRFHPRAWSLEHASVPANVDAWGRVLASFDESPWG